MKTFILGFTATIFLCCIAWQSIAQNTVVTDDPSYTGNSAAMLDVKSINKGFLVPRLTSVQMALIASPALGLLVFNTDLNGFCYYNGTTWLNLTSGMIPAGVGLDEALFVIRNASGDTVFAVYPEGVRIKVSDGIAKGSGNKGGFAVGGFGTGKLLGKEFLRVTPDSVRVYVDGIVKGSGNKGGFSVGGYGTGKVIGQEYLRVTTDSVRIYVNPNPPKGSGNKGGFAVGGFGTGKALPESFLHLNPENYFIGHQAGISTTGMYNSFIGYKSGFSNTGGFRNIFVGYYSGFNNLTGSNNIFIGDSAGYMNTSGLQNVYIGNNAGRSNSTGGWNVGIGYYALYANTTGLLNTAVGSYSLGKNTIGNYNSAFGHGALQKNIGHTNTAVGTYALEKNTIGVDNTSVGAFSLSANIDGNANIALGSFSLLQNTNGSDNISVGKCAMQNNTEGDRNISIGTIGLLNNTTGNYNLAIGYSSLYNNTTGNSNTAIGYNTFYNGATYSNSTAIGNDAQITSSNQVRIGDNFVTSFYCKGATAATTNTPNMYVETNGQIMRSSVSVPTGSGAVSKVSFWTASNVLGYSNNLHWDNINAFFGIAAPSPTEKLEIGGTSSKIYLNSATSNAILFNQNGIAPPAKTTRSAGTKLILSPQVSATDVDFALGIESSALWYSVPLNNSTYSHKFYAGTAELMRIRGDGNVGIGTTTPEARLEVVGAEATAREAGILNTRANYPQFILNATSGSANAKIWRMIGRSSNSFEIQTLDDTYSSEVTAMQFIRSGIAISKVLFPNGNVGIGRSPVANKLEVEGNINVQKNAFTITLTASEAVNVGEIVYAPVGGTANYVSKNVVGNQRIIGVAVTSTTASGQAISIAIAGAAQVKIDNASTVGHWVQGSSTIAGSVQSTNTDSKGTFGIFLEGGGIAGDLKWMVFKISEGY